MNTDIIDRMIKKRFSIAQDAVVVHIGPDNRNIQSKTLRYGRPAIAGKTETRALEKSDELARFPELTLYSEGHGKLSRPERSSALKTETGGYVAIAVTTTCTLASLEGFLCALAVRSDITSDVLIDDALGVAATETRKQYEYWMHADL